MHLIKLSDFVLMKNESGVFQKDIEQIRKYAEFLQQDLTLQMFLPCDKNGRPFEGKPLSPNTDAEWIRWENEKWDYLKAKSLMVFENVHHIRNEIQKGFSIYFVGRTPVFNIADDGGHLYWYFHTVESLLKDMGTTIETKESF